MDSEETVELITRVPAKDENGIYKRDSESSYEVYAQIDSVTASEFFEGGRNGLNPQLRVKVYVAEYKNQKVVKVRGIRYTVYRTYREPDSDMIELYLALRQGNA